MNTDVPTYWNGERCMAIRGTAVVADQPEIPKYWARGLNLIGRRIPVVRVYYHASQWILDDRAGRGWRKVTEHRGSPAMAHSEVVIEADSFIPRGLDP